MQDGRTTFGVHYEGTAFQGFLPGSDCPFLPHYYQRVRGLGEYAGKEPLYSYFIGAQVVCPSNICCDPYSCRARHEYRCHQAPYRTYPAGRMRIAYTRLHRIFRSWHSERPYCHARAVDETGNRTGNGFLFPVGQYVPPDAPPHLLRYGLYAD